MKRYGMVIDLQKCVGCGACALACKTENNTPLREDGQTFNWADFIFETKGKFPNLKFSALPTLCNHCTDAPCVKACPVKPKKAMFKTKDGITMHNDKRCIGCRRCQKACPYSVKDVVKENVEYSVISFNSRKHQPHSFFRDKTEIIKGGTSSGMEIAKKIGKIPPHQNDYSTPEYDSVRRKGIVEKCILCSHRLAKKELPYCVVSCPSRARVFGDLNDPKSDAAKLLKKHKGFRLKESAGTKPNVHYVRSFGKS